MNNDRVIPLQKKNWKRLAQGSKFKGKKSLRPNANLPGGESELMIQSDENMAW